MIKKWKVYWPFATNAIKQNLAYRGGVALFILTSMFGVFISYFLWMAIYGSSDSGVLGGLTRNEMILYVFMSYVTGGIVNIGIADEISDHVVQGTVAMNLIKPIDYRMSLIFKAIGNQIYQFLVPAVFIWIGLEVYKVAFLGMPVVTIPRIVLYLCSCFMSFLIFVLFDFCFGMIAFFTTYIFGMMMAKDALMAFLTGQLIPLSFFPGVLQRIFDFLPFSSMMYTPVMIYLGKYEGAGLMFVLARQAVWVVLLYVLGSLVWKQVTKRLVVLGG